ncbi:MAG: hypothetical protein CMA27_03360 [Euryarchaeota archaeon]|nr:hypothetical protein [Euryarchaeota archaeon]|tara:strand:+ start:3703 stop:4626 length:924 start_codon:yes stop_codon:yes gene_type:complete
MKVFINNAKEDWIVDRFIYEWNRYNFKQKKQPFIGKHIIWLIAPWTWKKVPVRSLKKNKVLCTIHHIDEEKFDNHQLEEFTYRDKYVDHYHVISDKTLQQVRKLTSKPITTIPFWVNQNLWFQIKDKDTLYKKYNLNKSNYFVGSFQRDTEGHDLISPKLSKGPDRLIEIFKHLNEKEKNLNVVLAGKRRNYIIEQLNKAKIPYHYFEMASFSEINELYNLLNLYIVSSRVEGGPAAIMECGLNKTPLISTDVGIASEVLDRMSIFDMNNFHKAKPNPDYAYKSVQKYKIPHGFQKFNNLLEDINEN